MGRVLVIGEEGQDIVDELKPLENEIVIDKPGKNSFYKTNLDELLQRNKIRNLLVTGVTTDVCCFTTVSGANDHGFNAIVLEDCVASYNPDRHTAALDIIASQGGIFGLVSSSSNVLEALNKADAVSTGS
jgi:nicotinamidase-related amidase